MPMRVWVCVCVTHTDKEASLGPPDPVRCEETSNIQSPHPPQEQEDKQNRKRKEEEGGRGRKRSQGEPASHPCVSVSLPSDSAGYVSPSPSVPL